MNIKTVRKWLGKRRLDKVEEIFVDEWFDDGVGIEIWLKEGYIVDTYFHTVIRVCKKYIS